MFFSHELRRPLQDLSHSMGLARLLAERQRRRRHHDILQSVIDENRADDCVGVETWNSSRACGVCTSQIERLTTIDLGPSRQNSPAGGILGVRLVLTCSLQLPHRCRAQWSCCCDGLSMQSASLSVAMFKEHEAEKFASLREAMLEPQTDVLQATFGPSTTSDAA